MKHSSAQQNFVKPGSRVLPVERSGFELQAERLGLATLEDQKRSRELEAWARKYRHRRFVPEDLLNYWGLEVRLGSRSCSTEDF